MIEQVDQPAARRHSQDERDVEAVMIALHDQHAATLLRFAMSLTRGERYWAEDVVQETLLRVWRNVGSIPGDAEGARRWLLTVTRRVHIDMIRMREARPTEVSLIDANVTTIADAADAAVAARALTEAFGKLSAPHQAVLRELYVEGRTIEEAAARAGVPAGTVKSRSHYALRALRLAIDPHYTPGKRRKPRSEPFSVSSLPLPTVIHDHRRTA
ncbi:sigma-70 family RNA polymerase sigma factor [Winogradskya consettensis]|uniref:RNA polymerase sigma factor n=1 Tax=Winogradskya consettensis TaxID=113560 RepID=A0A919SCI7_9ACTN|nr:sigma-70 family RNA polymerase sigma factor [Actinoplanes consettensis]GIM68058.1 RNA polymerase sigma factor [Actinoplanes consettensis]